MTPIASRAIDSVEGSGSDEVIRKMSPVCLLSR